ncbi:MAG TPA: TIGR04283 family arsenosugar biosynthesis glycosyltransferase [Vicinamibacteria bacterium]|nr:TIGR04283 family arsenosugar biosynthesis glycosyltransferase [Vicinamibacteria bacterium]
MGTSISVVIPALDEEDVIATAVRSVRDQAEVIVVDGGSHDATREMAEKEGARVLVTGRGRGLQLDAGARAASGEWVVFLHADTRLETGWASALLALPAGVAGGAFELSIDSPRPAFRLIELAVRCRVRLLGLPYGDQALFVRRALYAGTGGVPHLPLMEDVAFVRRLARAGPLAWVPLRARTSARRWERLGVVATTLRNWSLIALYGAGVPAERLARLYHAGRPAEPAPSRLDRPPDGPL